MNLEQTETSSKSTKGAIGHVLLFWAGYLAITQLLGFATGSITPSVWRLATWGLISSGALIALTLLLLRKEDLTAKDLGLVVRPSSFKRLSVGLLIGSASLGVHLLVVTTLAGPVRLESVPGPIVAPAALYLTQFILTSCMEEQGFRGYALQRLSTRLGMWPAILITATAFGLSHLSYGWDMRTIVVGVIPCGVLWGMSAVASRGLAVPIGLHASWNFASWLVGDKRDPGLFRMVVEDSERLQAVATTSFLAVFGLLTLAFWLVHRRQTSG